MVIGKSINRVDAIDKVLGRAKFTEDLIPANALVGRVMHSTIANGLVKTIDTSKALLMDGVIKVVSCFDVPNIQFPTAGHPWSLDESHQDVRDRKILNQRVRHYGDCIAAVLAKDEIIAARAIAALNVEYEEYPVLLDPAAALESEADAIHLEYPDNILKKTNYTDGDWQAAVHQEGLLQLKKKYLTVPVQHCHIENPVCFAYMEGDRIVVVSSTQIPHIVRRVVSQALGIPLGRIRVIKPYVGGGFGNKQDVIYEPLAAYLTMVAGGHCVCLNMSREETFSSSRTRHGMEFYLHSWVDRKGNLAARYVKGVSNQGGYASHGHTVLANAISGYRNLYHQQAIRQEAVTVYTNICSGGAMRAYGIPQINFAMESHMDDLAQKLCIDPIDFRKRNMMRVGDVDPGTGIICHSNGLEECLNVGKSYIDWQKKRELYREQSGDIRRGVGMAIFSYKTGAYPSAMEIGSARVILNQDGSVQVQMGATEIGQGADTVFSQMAAETIGIEPDQVHVISTQDTDTTPFDTGAYGSRQSYVSGAALKQTCLLFLERIFCYAAERWGCNSIDLDLRKGMLQSKVTGQTVVSLKQLAMNAFYSREHAMHITAESSYQCKDNTYALGCCFAEIEVDIRLGRIKILDIVNVHDSGRIINPMLAKAQVHGGMAMGLGYALSEQMLYNREGKLLNGNFLDYKLPTAMDIPPLQVRFVETYDPSSPYGNKSLGEPPVIPVAAAVRNALLCATGVAIDQLPMNPPCLIKAFQAAGLI
ncbi:xanthine dehydrogenase subunit XdhA [Candidatus Formimonas warabiya]|uniref:Xanthine dehydrogenase molybdenum-binding subunit XdhA n=1 Tax=Formimonas warabiya TaxID=1761012 RepID=A0A3G1KM94_FORW1|nr:xanthine dehydrogenase subunit XdhA [Candidatus Formimonas warabiya]ATW23553.1 xanthine dehydrogenase molybdenum-binding subunit XdhA [Candidatus Formimonas warabiya]